MKLLLKKIYTLLPLKPVLFAFIKKLLPLPQIIYKHLHFIGIIKVKLDRRHYFKMMHYGYQLENEIFWKGLQGGWEKESMKLWIKLCDRENQTIIDVGANTGVFSLVAKAMQRDNKVIALEPVSRVFKKLEYNNKINGFDIRCLELAASNYSGAAIIYDTGGEHIYSVTVNKNLNDSYQLQEVAISTITLDDLFRQYGIA